MKVAVVFSERDPASVNIRKQLLGSYGFQESGSCWKLTEGNNAIAVHSFDSEMIHLEGIDKAIDADVFIFASKHVSKAGVDAFTVHVPGNWGRAEFGGIDKKLCVAPAELMKAAFRELQNNSMGMEVIQEATHHGPFIGKPGMFIEIGSRERMYKNVEAGKIVADAIINAIKAVNNITESSRTGRLKSAVGIGGQHHCPNFRKILLETDISVAHVCAKYALGSLDEEMLRQAMEKTLPKASMVVLDWKGLGSHKERIKKLLNESGIDFSPRTLSLFLKQEAFQPS